MANEGSPSPGARAGRKCGPLTRVDLLTFLVAAMLCSASYCLGIWHNSRGAADSRILGPSAAFAVGATPSCPGDADEPIDFESHHAAESAGLSVSSSSSPAAATTSARRALRGVVGVAGRNRVAWAWGSAEFGGGLRLGGADAVRR